MRGWLLSVRDRDVDAIYRFRGFALDPRERTLVQGRKRIKVRPRSFDVLSILVANAGNLVDRETLLRQAWGGLAVSDEVLKVTVHELRAKLRDDAKRPSFIETVTKAGYRFIAPVVIQRRHTGGTRALVGREPELTVLRRALQGEVRCIHLHGIGGIGKTTVVNAFERECVVAHKRFVRIDARDVACLPAEFLHALARALGTEDRDPLAVLDAQHGRIVVVVDSYEHLFALDRWIRETLLPALPTNALLILAGRVAPSADWRGELGWGDTLCALPIDELHLDDARRLLRVRGVSIHHDQAVLGFTRGHPLALCLVADLIAKRPDVPLEPYNAPDLVQAVLARVVKDVDDDRHQAALDVCSLARHVTEALLTAVLGGPDARHLMRWLASQSFIELGPHGVFPHDLARDVMFADLKWRNPGRLSDLVERTSAYLANRLCESGMPAGLRLADELLFLHSHHPVIGAFTPWRGAEGLVVEPAIADDVRALVEIVTRQEGTAAARIAKRWLDRQLAGALLVRDGSRTPAGFQLTIRLDEVTPEDIDADPAARIALQHVVARGGHRRGRAILLNRFMMARDTYQEHSPIQSLLGSQVMRMYLTTPRLDWAFTCMAEPERWAAQLEAAFGAQLLPPYEHDGRTYGLFWHCFRDLTPAAWLVGLARRGIDVTAPATRALDRDELRAAVGEALRSLHRPDELEDSPLLASGLLTGSARTTTGIRTLLVEAVDALSTAPRGDKLRTALLHSYLQPSPSHEVAAKRAGMAPSTYRRNVALAIDQVTDHLWHRQRLGR